MMASVTAQPPECVALQKNTFKLTKAISDLTTPEIFGTLLVVNGVLNQTSVDVKLGGCNTPFNKASKLVSAVDTYIKDGPDKSRAERFKVLVKICSETGLTVIEQQLSDEYRKLLVGGTDPSIPIGDPPSTPIRDEIDAYERRFHCIVINIQKLFMKKGIDVNDVKMHVCELPVHLKGTFGQIYHNYIPKIHDTKSIPELFGVLTPFWDYLHPQLLQHIVDYSNVEEAKTLMSDYTVELHSFRERVKLGDYMSVRRANLVEDDFNTIVAAWGDDWLEKTLADAERVRYGLGEALSVLHFLPKLNGLRLQCIAMVFSLPRSVEINIEKIRKYFQKCGAEQVSVNGTIIYHEQTSIPESYIQPSLEPLADEDTGQGGYDYDFVEDVPLELICNICTKPLREPQLMVCCGQHYCESCLVLWFRKHDKRICPYCRAEGDKLNYVINKEKRSAIIQLKIRCTSKTEGCTWEGELGSLNQHYERCKVAIDCPNKCLSSKGRNMKIMKRDLDDHLKNRCYLRQYQCEHCGLQDTYQNITGHGSPYKSTSHYSVCPEFPLECPNKCGEKEIKRRDMEDHRGECPQEVVGCPFQEAGCDHKVVRQDLDHHLATSQEQHLSLVTKDYEKNKQELRDTSQELEDTKDELKRAKHDLEDANNKLVNSKSELEDAKDEIKDAKKQLIDTKDELNQYKKDGWLCPML